MDLPMNITELFNKFGEVAYQLAYLEDGFSQNDDVDIEDLRVYLRGFTDMAERFAIELEGEDLSHINLLANTIAAYALFLGAKREYYIEHDKWEKQMYQQTGETCKDYLIQ